MEQGFDQIEQIDHIDRETSTNDPSLRWEIMKNGIVEFCQWKSKKKANEQKIYKTNLEKKLAALLK